MNFIPSSQNKLRQDNFWWHNIKNLVFSFLLTVKHVQCNNTILLSLFKGMKYFELKYKDKIKMITPQYWVKKGPTEQLWENLLIDYQMKIG